MSKILNSIASATPEAPEPVQSASQAGEIMAIAEKGMAAFAWNFADWIGFASQMVNSNGSVQMASRLNFPLANMCQLAHGQLFGNRAAFKTIGEGKTLRYDLDEQGNRQFIPVSESEMRDQNIRFAARQNLEYWETRLASYHDIDGQTVLITQKDGVEQRAVIDPASDLTYADVQVRHHEALTWHNTWSAFSDLVNGLYEAIYGEPYIYTPFERKAAARTTTGALALAASLRK